MSEDILHRVTIHIPFVSKYEYSTKSHVTAPISESIYSKIHERELRRIMPTPSTQKKISA